MNELNSLKENKGIEEKEENKPSTQDSERLNELLKAYSLDELAEFTKKGIAIKDIPLRHIVLPTGENFTPDVLEDFLDSRKMEVKWNEITKAIDFKGRGFIGQAQEHIGANIVHLLYSELQGCYKRCTLDTIAGYLNIVATRNIYNPVVELLAETKWDGQDHIAELCDIIGIDEDDKLSRTLVKKWLMQSIAMLQNNIEAPFGADGVLVLQGEQGTGKTSLFRQLAMHREFFKDGVTLNFSDKDTAIRATSCWIAEMGEIESTTLKSDVERLKSFITAEVDEYRRPYARGDTRSARHTSFCGSCNNIDFLSDQTGNRRFWTVESSGKINFKQLTPEKVKQIWAQANVLLCEGGLQSFRLTDSERDALAARNSSHTVKMKGEAEIEDLLNSSGKHKMAYREMTITEWKDLHLNVLRPYTVNQIGKVLDKLGVEMKTKKVNGKVAKVRMLPYIVYS